MPAQIWINPRNGDVLLQEENGQRHSGPLRITAGPEVQNIKIIVVATCGCKNPLIIEPLPEGSGAALEIFPHG